MAASAPACLYQQRKLAAQVYIIPLYIGLNIAILDNRVRNFLPNPNVFMNDWNIGDWWTA